jgi:hypothetical protein
MDRDPANRLSCVVCGLETRRHSGWFLVMDNCWLDRVKVWAWHPALARQGRMRSVCGRVHLKVLLTHWLNHANLQLVASGTVPFPAALDDSSFDITSDPALGEVVGELAVQRETISQGWTGSPAAMECILNELIGGTETPPRSPGLPLPDRTRGYSREYAFY